MTDKRCPRLLNLNQTPGRTDSPDEPPEERVYRCLQPAGHPGPHSFETGRG